MISELFQLSRFPLGNLFSSKNFLCWTQAIKHDVRKNHRPLEDELLFAALRWSIRRFFTSRSTFTVFSCLHFSWEEWIIKKLFLWYNLFRFVRKEKQVEKFTTGPCEFPFRNFLTSTNSNYFLINKYSTRQKILNKIACQPAFDSFHLAFHHSDDFGETFTASCEQFETNQILMNFHLYSWSYIGKHCEA